MVPQSPVLWDWRETKIFVFHPNYSISLLFIITWSIEEYWLLLRRCSLVLQHLCFEPPWWNNKHSSFAFEITRISCECKLVVTSQLHRLTTPKQHSLWIILLILHMINKKPLWMDDYTYWPEHHRNHQQSFAPSSDLLYLLIWAILLHSI